MFSSISKEELEDLLKKKAQEYGPDWCAKQIEVLVRQLVAKAPKKT